MAQVRWDFEPGEARSARREGVRLVTYVPCRMATIGKVRIAGFRSLVDTSISVGSPYAVVAGPNNSGKSTLSDALEFLGDVFRSDLPGAINLAGGFERVCDHYSEADPRRISFEVLGRMPRTDWATAIEANASEFAWAGELECSLAFEIVSPAGAAGDSDSLGDYWVDSETFTISVHRHGSRAPVRLFRYHRAAAEPDTVKVTSRVTGAGLQYRELIDRLAPFLQATEGRGRSKFAGRLFERLANQTRPDELVFESFKAITYPGWRLSRVAEGMRTFHFAADDCRRPAAATPSVALGSHGEDLAAVVRHLRSQSPAEWERAVSFVRCLLPTLSDVRCEVSRARMLSLEFVLDSGTVWGSDQVSDGTVLATALAAALLDPRATLVVLDEPEIGLHPWVVRRLVDFCDELEDRQVVLVTHSPVLLSEVHPSRVVIASSPGTHSHLTPLTELDPEIVALVEAGVTDVATLLDHGGVAEAVPDFL